MIDLTQSHLQHKLMGQALGMQDFPRLVSLATNLLPLTHVPGAMVEFGCNKGLTAAFLSSLAPGRALWVYDSFQGFPENSDGHRTGDLACTEEEVRKTFTDAGVPIPDIVPGFFSKINPPLDLPYRIAFAHIDCDLFSSTFNALHHVWPRMSPGGVIVVDDYGDTRFPGVRRAVDTFKADLRGYHSLPTISPIQFCFKKL